MGILDKILPVYYKILRMGIQQQSTDVVAVYDISIQNENGDGIATINQGSVLTSQEKQAIASIFHRDKVAFEAATGLTELT